MSAIERSRSLRRQVAEWTAPTPGYVQYVYALVLVWGLGDVLSTYAAVFAVGDPSMEFNPWMRVLLATDPLLMLAVKAAAVLVAGVVLLECRTVVEEVPGWQLWFAGVVTIGWAVVLNNLAIAIAVAA